MTVIESLVRGIVRAASLLVPREERPRWTQEWEAEIAHRFRGDLDTRASLQLLRRSGGAFRHALWHLWEAWRWESFSQDFRQAVRALGQRPGFVVSASITLAAGVGSATALFSVIQAVLLAPPAYREPDRLMVLWSNLDLAGYKRAPLSGPELLDLRQQARSFEDIAAIWTTTAQISGEGEPEQLRVGLVTANFFSLLGVEPRLGRNFEPTEEGQGAPRVVILSDALWRRRFGADPRVVGRTVHMDGGSVTVVGVAPPELRLAFAPDANVPPELQAFAPFPSDHARDPRDQYYLRTVGRLAPGASAEEAERVFSVLESSSKLGIRVSESNTTFSSTAPKRLVAA